MATTVQLVETKHAAPAAAHPWARAAWRRPSCRAALVLLAAALAALLPCLSPPAAAQSGPACSGLPPFQPVGEIKSQDGRLQAVMKVISGDREVPARPGAPLVKATLRYFYGYNPTDSSQEWPTKSWTNTGPGPTLRSRIGDVVTITLLNQVKLDDFPGTLDSGEEGKNNGCDKGSTGTTTDQYPFKDKYPNCFHGSSSANIHFHGTHVTPATTGDNILINVRPNPTVTEADVKPYFDEIFKDCKLGQQPHVWGQLPHGWSDSPDNPKSQKNLLLHYDQTAPYVGPGRNPDGHGLPPALQLWPQNQKAIDQGVWPQWYSGSYPYCFQIPKYTEEADGKSNVVMGQAPGTHWYHSHKHGSTSINLFNGLAGAFIIADDSPTGYDGKLKEFYTKGQGGLEEKVLVIQQITTVVNMLSATGGTPPLLVNGELTPTITMRPGQVQLWRMINATVQGFVNARFQPAAQLGGGFNYRQTAQDGVQLAWENFSNSQNGTQSITMSPANRVDFLVQAPTTPGCYMLQDSRLGPIVAITVAGTPITIKPAFPGQASDYPTLPSFLKDIDPAEVRLRRQITYGSEQPKDTTSRRALQFTIDGKQFEDQKINQVMLLDSTEEWTLYNADIATGITHPFHIHVNPFQIVEIYDPNTMTQPQKLSPPYVWWDTFAIPPPKKLADGTVVPGYFKMRSRFADFTGQYVQHCHILAHEDRGMMQLLEVVTDRTVLKHH